MIAQNQIPIYRANGAFAFLAKSADNEHFTKLNITSNEGTIFWHPKNIALTGHDCSNNQGADRYGQLLLFALK